LGAALGAPLPAPAPPRAAPTTLLTELRTDVNRLLEDMPRQPRFPPVNWLALSASEAEEVWTELGEWVDAKLVGRHFANRGQLPDCWPLHPGAVEQLTWLWRSWLHAMLPLAGANPSAEWHTRWHRDALANVPAEVIQEAGATRRDRCGPGIHFGSPLPGAEQPTRPEPAHLREPAPPVPVASPPAPGSGWMPGPGEQPAGPPTWNSAPQPGPQPWNVPPTFTGDGSVPPMFVPRDPAQAVDLGVDPTSALAERRYWWPHLETARAADVARRLEDEQRAEEAKRLAEEAKAGESAPE
jgi:hypothetical protein